MSRVTLSAIARAAEVSVATVSKALTPHADRCDIAPATRARIRAVAEGLGWHPQRVASSRPRKRFGAVGLLFDACFPFGTGAYERFYEFASAEFASRGLNLFFVPAQDVARWHRQQVMQRLDGVIAVGSVNAALLADLAASHYPTVLLNHASSLGFDQVLCDDRGGAAALARHARDQGCSALLFVCEQSDRSHASVGERREGLLATCAGLGIAAAAIAPAGLERALAAHAGAARLAVVCYHSSLLPTVARQVRRWREGSATPLLLASWNLQPWFDLADPPVTAVAVPMQAMLIKAADRLIARLDDPLGAVRREVLLQTVIPPA